MPFRMNSASRHSRQGGDAEKDNLQPKGALEITPYEEQRNRRTKALHEEVQRALLDLGFGEPAELRPLFTGEMVDKEDVGDTNRNVSRAHWKKIRAQEDLQLRRSDQNVAKVNANTDTSPILSHQNKRVRDTKGRTFSSKCMHTGC